MSEKETKLPVVDGYINTPRLSHSTSQQSLAIFDPSPASLAVISSR